MARKIIEVYEDDLTGETVQGLTPTRFALDGVEYQIDLGPTSRAAFDAAVAPYRQVARRVGRASRDTRSATSRQPARTDPEQLRAVRAWWAANHQAADLPPANDRGRIPAAVTEAYHSAGGRNLPTPPRRARKPAK
jgi:hypothetical protein